MYGLLFNNFSTSRKYTVNRSNTLKPGINICNFSGVYMHMYRQCTAYEVFTKYKLHSSSPIILQKIQPESIINHYLSRQNQIES